MRGRAARSIAAKYLGDPEQFWRICDANGAVRPDELEMVGRRLRITLPEGLRVEDVHRRVQRHSAHVDDRAGRPDTGVARCARCADRGCRW